MSPFFVFAALFMWLIGWCIVLNKGLKARFIYVEQAVVSMLAAVAIQSLNEWSTIATWFVTVVLSLLYYINLIHIRYFGDFVPVFQIKQFASSEGAAGIYGSMLLQAASRLIKFRDLYHVFALFIMMPILFGSLSQPDLFVESRWAFINVLLGLLIVLTISRYKKIKNGIVETNRFGMFLSYLLTWSVKRKQQSWQDEIIRDHSNLLEMSEHPQIDSSTESEWYGKFKGMNVILIQLESFQQFLMHRHVDGQEITPFLNQIARENVQFSNIYSQFAMGHTCDAELAALHSLYPMKDEIINYKHYDKKYFGLPSILKKHGYEAHAYHGYKGDFYNRNVMMKTYGFETFSSEEDYPVFERVASNWMSDFSFFDQSIQKIKQAKQPFFSFMISLSSHFPFNLDEKYRELRVDSEIPEFLASYYQSVNFTDRALRHFYEKLEQEGLLENTLLAFYGDHEGVTLEHFTSLFEHLGMPQSNELYPINQMLVRKVPFIIASGNQERRQAFKSDICGSTLDVGQTLLHLLGLPSITYGMGESLFHAAEDRVIPLAQHNLGSFVTNEIACLASRSGIFSESLLYNHKSKEFIVPRSGKEEHDYNFSKQQLIMSDYIIKNDLLIAKEEHSDSLEPLDETMLVSFTPMIERILDMVDDEVVVFPLTRIMDIQFFKDQENNPESMAQLEKYYRKARNKNIRFYSTFDLSTNDKSIWFEDTSFIIPLQEAGYTVKMMNRTSLPAFLNDLPDDSFIIVSAKDEASNQFKHEFVSEMKAYGFHKLNTTKLRHSYVNLIYKNKGYMSLFEEVTEQAIVKHFYNNELIKGVMLPFDLSVTSKGYMAGNVSDIRVNGISSSRNLRGLNFVAIDSKNENVTKFHVDTFVTTNVNSGIYVATKEQVVMEVDL